MRASRSTEVYDEFGPYKESKWIGHTSKVAHDHYLQMRDEDFDMAAEVKLPTPGKTSNALTDATRATENVPPFSL